jgi:hypothetical protein
VEIKEGGSENDKNELGRPPAIEEDAEEQDGDVL